MARELPMTHVPVFEKLGESQVRMQFAKHSDEVGVQAREWLLLKEQERAAASAAKRDEREEETLSIARSALSNSRRANHIAIAAAIFAAIAAIAAVIAIVIGVMYSSPK